MKRSMQLAVVVMTVFAMNQNVNAQLFPTYIDGAFSLGNASGSEPYALADTFLLETNPGASKTIYLDYDGHHSFDSVWGHDIVFDSFDRNGNVNSFSNSELREIQRQFQNIAEDFAPFDVNVTTRDPGYDALVRSNGGDTTYGIRVLNTQNEPGSGAGGGGTAYINSFNWVDDRDNVAFVFNKGANNGGMTNSHEIGHTLGLGHDGLGSSTYHPGAGSGTTEWGPLMGAPFGANVTQWSNGDYTDSTNTQDDLAIITKGANGISYKADDYGDFTGTAHLVSFDGSGIAFEWGFIERNTDIDFFRFDLQSGELSLDIKSFQGRPNLDILAKLYDSGGTEISFSNPFTDVNASFMFNIATADTYYLSIEGTGVSGLNSDYGSLGFFTVDGSFLSAVPEPTSCIMFGSLGLFFARRRRRR